MGATIDHLRADQQVHVLRAFTDARGRSHDVGASGIIRSMGLDTQTMELWIEWETRGGTERLFFALRATHGPGNGRMREYFALGSDVVQEARAPEATPAREPEVRARSAPAVRSHPDAGTNLGDVAVACECDPALHRPVLALGTGVHACLRCGTVTVTHTIGDDGRHTGNDWLNYVVDDVAEPLLQWLARWPRVSVRRHDLDGWPRAAGLRRDDTVYLAADTRCETAVALHNVERAAVAREFDGLFPDGKPPGTLPPRMLAFAQFAAAAQLTPRSTIADLMVSADPHNAACAVAVSQLQQRPDAFEVMVEALRSENVTWQGAGAAMAFAAKPFDPRLPDVLVDLVSHLAVLAHASAPGRIAHAVRFQELLAVIAEHTMNTDAMCTALPLLQRRVAPLDADLAGHIGYVLRVLHGIPERKSGFRF